jgi:small ligand-binding sensory domain FIST
MKWSTALSTRPAALEASAEAAVRAAQDLGGAKPDLAFVFLAGYDAEQEATAAIVLPELLHAKHVLGCVAAGVLSGGREIEGKRGVSVTLAALGDAEYRVFHASAEALPDDDSGPAGWRKLAGLPPERTAGFVLLADGVSDSALKIVEGLDFAYPGVPKVGGIESGRRAPGRGRLFYDGRFESSGVAGVAFSTDVSFTAAVAQGARPFGDSGVVTRAERHFLRAIDREPALDFLRIQLSKLDEVDQRRPLGSVCVGLGADPFLEGEPEAGDYLVRNLLGADEDSGAVAVGDEVHSGRRVRLHLRDAAASAADLRAVLRRRPSASAPAGALLFSCAGRGAAFYGESDHDSRVFREIVGETPLGGFFCAGEIGPVGGRTFLHGYTSSFAIIGTAPRAGA